MNILWILNGCGLEGRSITGGPVRFHEISRRWSAREGVRQHVLTTSGGAEMLRTLGCTLPYTLAPASVLLEREPCRAFRLWSYGVTALCAQRVLRTRVPAEFASPDLVITVSDYFCDIVPALEAKKRGARWVAWIHHRELPPSQRPGNRVVNTLTHQLQEWSLRMIARHADCAWVYNTEAGDQVRERLCALGMQDARIRRMRCGIDLQTLTDAPVPTRASVDAVMVGVRPNKGMHDILPIWKEVLKLRPGTTLRLMGGMSGEAALLAQIRAQGLDSVIEVFRPENGFLPAPAYAATLKEARLLFAPSHEEGWGIAVCEAMAAGLPVAAYDLPVYRRIYGDSFVRVPCFDAQAFAKAVVALLEQSELYARYQAAGLQMATAYGWDPIAHDDFESFASTNERNERVRGFYALHRL